MRIIKVLKDKLKMRRTDKLEECTVDELYYDLTSNARGIARIICEVICNGNKDTQEDTIRMFEIESHIYKRIFACAYNLIDECKEKYPREKYLE